MAQIRIKYYLIQFMLKSPLQPIVKLSETFGISEKMQNSSIAAPPDEVYQTFKDAGFSPELFALFGLKMPIALAGLATNIGFVWLTARCKQLQSNCGLLLALNFANFALYLFHPFPSFFLTLSGINFMPLWICFWFQLGPLVAVTAQFCLCLAIGLDRLFSLVLPIFYKMRYCHKKWRNLAVIGLLCYAYSVPSLISAWNFSMAPQNARLPVQCIIPDIVPLEKEIWRSFVINLATAFCYSLFWAVLKVRTRGGQLADTGRQLAKSVLLIMLLEILGWLTNNLLRILFEGVPMSPLTRMRVDNSTAYLLYLVLALQAPLLLWLSTDYGQAFRQYFGPTLRTLRISGSSTNPPIGIGTTAVMAKKTNQISVSRS